VSSSKCASRLTTHCSVTGSLYVGFHGYEKLVSSVSIKHYVGFLRQSHKLTVTSVLSFIITMLILAADFYYLKNIAGRRLVGLRWWNEVNPETGDSHWVFESSDPSTKVISATDKRFFWLALYIQPLLWVVFALFAIIKFEFIWLTLVGEYFDVVGVGIVLMCI
jgi:hypothetical protein